MIQKKGHMTAVKHYFFGLMTAVGIVSALWCQSFVSLADSTGKVIAESAKIREKADTGSEAVGSVSYGKTITIVDEVQDSSGTLWYQVHVDGNTTGYIRSDLVDKQGDGNSGGDTGQETAQSESSASGASIDPDTSIDPQYAVVSAETIKVRTAPSTNDGVVDRLTRDAQVIVSGQSDGSDGKLWYYVTFTGTNGAERTGYIRSDLLSLGDMVPVPEEVSEPQEPVLEPEEPVDSLDYELTYETSVDGSGELEWYLYDYTTEDSPYNRYRLEDLMAATKVRSENDAKDAKTLVRQRIVIVVLIVLVVALIVLAVIMALKLRDVYYEDYEDEEEEEEGEETPSQRKRRSEEREETSSQRRRREREEGEASSQRRSRTEKEETRQHRRRTQGSEDSSERRRRRMEDDDAPVRRRRRAEEEGNEADSASAAADLKRKSKNFLLDDDEFEFEFLNMDDKNL